VADATLVREELAHRHLVRLARKVRNVRLHLGVEIDLPLVDELQDRDGSHRLGN
jgi:hypothetical protein